MVCATSSASQVVHKNGHLTLLHTHSSAPYAVILHYQTSTELMPLPSTNICKQSPEKLQTDPGSPSFIPSPPLDSLHYYFPQRSSLAHPPNTNFKFRSCTERVFPFPSDPAVGAEPGEIQPGSLQDALLPRKSAGRRAAQPEEPARHRRPPHQNHPGTPGDFLRLLLSCAGKEYVKRRRFDLLDV